MENSSDTAIIAILGILCLTGYLAPTIIALIRNHHYKWVLFAINLIFGMTGIGYLIAFIWAVWPRKTAILDVVANDPTTNSHEAGQKVYEQMGSNIRAFRDAANPSSTATPSKFTVNEDCDEILRRLAKLKEEGIITEEEFGRKKSELLGF